MRNDEVIKPTEIGGLFNMDRNKKCIENVACLTYGRLGVSDEKARNTRNYRLSG